MPRKASGHLSIPGAFTLGKKPCQVFVARRWCGTLQVFLAWRANLGLNHRVLLLPNTGTGEPAAQHSQGWLGVIQTLGAHMDKHCGLAKPNALERRAGPGPLPAGPFSRSWVLSGQARGAARAKTRWPRGLCPHRVPAMAVSLLSLSCFCLCPASGCGAFGPWALSIALGSCCAHCCGMAPRPRRLHCLQCPE